MLWIKINFLHKCFSNQRCFRSKSMIPFRCLVSCGKARRKRLFSQGYASQFVLHFISKNKNPWANPLCGWQNEDLRAGVVDISMHLHYCALSRHQPFSCSHNFFSSERETPHEKEAITRAWESVVSEEGLFNMETSPKPRNKMQPRGFLLSFALFPLPTLAGAYCKWQKNMFGSCTFESCYKVKQNWSAKHNTVFIYLFDFYLFYVMAFY